LTDYVHKLETQIALSKHFFLTKKPALKELFSRKSCPRRYILLFIFTTTSFAL